MSLLTRPALYYPHLQFTDPNWLKEALLSFRQVRRMAPAGYGPTAGDVAGPVRDVEIPGLGPMIMLELLDDLGPSARRSSCTTGSTRCPAYAAALRSGAHDRRLRQRRRLSDAS